MSQTRVSKTTKTQLFRVEVLRMSSDCSNLWIWCPDNSGNSLVNQIILGHKYLKVHPPIVDGYFGAFFRMPQIESFHHYFDAECIQNHFRNIVESCLAIKTLQCLYKPIISPSFSLDLTPKFTNFLWNFRIFYFRADFRPKFGKSTSEKCKNVLFQTK